MTNYMCICPVVGFCTESLVSFKPMGPGGFRSRQFEPQITFFLIRGVNLPRSMAMGTKMTQALTSSFFEAVFFLLLHSDSVCGKVLLADVKQNEHTCLYDTPFVSCVAL